MAQPKHHHCSCERKLPLTTRIHPPAHLQMSLTLFYGLWCLLRRRFSSYRKDLLQFRASIKASEHANPFLFSAGLRCAHIKNACRHHEPIFLNLLLCLQNSASRKNMDLREMNKHMPPPLFRAHFQPPEHEVDDGAQRTLGCATGSTEHSWLWQESLKGKQTKKKALRK